MEKLFATIEASITSDAIQHLVIDNFQLIFAKTSTTKPGIVSYQYYIYIYIYIYIYTIYYIYILYI